MAKPTGLAMFSMMFFVYQSFNLSIFPFHLFYKSDFVRHRLFYPNCILDMAVILGKS